MSDPKERASALVKEFKGTTYAFGSGVLDQPPGEDHGIRNTGHESLRIFVHHSPPMLQRTAIPEGRGSG